MCHICFIQLLEKRGFTLFEVYPSELSAGTVTEVATLPFEDALFLSQSFLPFFPLEADGVKGIQSYCELNISKALKS